MLQVAEVKIFRFSGKTTYLQCQKRVSTGKRMFRESVEQRRIVVPAALFYEWSRNKEKTFSTEKGSQCCIWQVSTINIRTRIGSSF